jgi:hypothetical protein
MTSSRDTRGVDSPSISPHVHSLNISSTVLIQTTFLLFFIISRVELPYSPMLHYLDILVHLEGSLLMGCRRLT